MQPLSLGWNGLIYHGGHGGHGVGRDVLAIQPGLWIRRISRSWSNPPTCI